MDDAEITKKANELINHCLALTLQLTRLGEGDNSPVGIASGFFFSVGESIYLILDTIG